MRDALTPVAAVTVRSSTSLSSCWRAQAPCRPTWVEREGERERASEREKGETGFPSFSTSPPPPRLASPSLSVVSRAVQRPPIAHQSRWLLDTATARSPKRTVADPQTGVAPRETPGPQCAFEVSMIDVSCNSH